MALFFSIRIGMLSSQTTWFKTYDFDIESQEPFGLTEFQDEYFILLDGHNQVHPVTENGIVKIDQDGQVIWHSTAAYPFEAFAEITVIFPSDMAVTKDGSVYFLSRSGFAPLKEYLLNKFDKNGHLLWLKTYAGDDSGMDDGEAGLELTEDSLGGCGSNLMYFHKPFLSKCFQNCSHRPSVQISPRSNKVC